MLVPCAPAPCGIGIYTTVRRAFRNSMNRTSQHITVRVIILYLALLATFTVLVTASSAIPRAAIDRNLKQSVSVIESEGEYPAHGSMLFTQDNFTDCVILNIAAGIDDKSPLQSAMLNTLHLSGNGIITDTRALLDGQPVAERPYARYWHGNQVLLRPLLCVTDYRGIRVINHVLLTLMALTCLLLCYTRVSRSLAMAMLLGLMVAGCWFVPLNMQYSACFYVALGAMLTLLLSPGRAMSHRWACLLFFALGSVTQYFDLLTTPLITLALPLIVWCMMVKPKHACRMVIVLSLMWIAGYALLWASKWVIASLITGTDVIGDAASSAMLRTMGSESAEHGATAQSIVSGYLGSVLRPATAGLLLAGIAVMGLLYWRMARPWRVVRSYTWLLLVAAMPLVWALTLVEHTYIHRFFTWRIIMVTAVAGLLFLFNTVDWRLILKKS